jgi:hypothetical protein
MQFYSYKLSSTNFQPVGFDVIGGKFEMINTPFSFSNGLQLNYYNFLSKTRDFSLNNKTGTLLTVPYGEFISNTFYSKENPEKVENLKEIRSAISDEDNNIYRHYSIYNTISGLEAKPGDYKNIDQLTFIFKDDYVYIEDIFGKILTNGGYGSSQTSFTNKTNPLNDYQKWNYILSNNTICLFAYNTNYGDIVEQNLSSKRLVLKKLTLDDKLNSSSNFIPDTANLRLISYFAYSNIDQYKSNPNNTFSGLQQFDVGTKNQKDINFIKNKNYIVKNNVFKKYNKYSNVFSKNVLDGTNKECFQNYLGIFPFENIKSNGNYDFYFHGLKNYQNLKYDYTNIPQTGFSPISKENLGVGLPLIFNSNQESYDFYNDNVYQNYLNKLYYRIYTGTNQINGYDKINLGYLSNTTTINFPANKKTDFYISPWIDIPLNKIDLGYSEFVNDGAIAGQYPYTSDRIYSYKDSQLINVPELQNIIKPSYSSDYKFLCTWLYGDKKGENIFPRWYDRYYNSAKYTQQQALTSTYMSYQDKTYTDKDYVFDVISQVNLKPNFLYSYYHVGNNDSKIFLDKLNYRLDSLNKIVYSNILNITSWDGDTLYDSSIYNNYGLTYGVSSNQYKNYFNLNGDNYAIFQANDTILPKQNFTVSMWLYFDDWSNINSYNIFGNFYDGGFGLISDSSSIVPLFTFVNNESKTIYNYNYKFTEASKIKTLIDIDFIQRLPDLSYWVISKSGMAIKYDVNNSIIYGPLDLKLPTVTQVEMDSSQYLYVYDNTLKQYTIITDKGDIVGPTKTSSDINRIEIDLNGVLIDGASTLKKVYGNCSVIDNDNYLWQIIGPNLYKEDRLIATVGASNQMTCDDYNNIWILGADETYTKVDKNGNILFKYAFEKKNLKYPTNCPPSPPPEPPKLKVLEEELPFLSTNDYKYILTLPDYYLILVTPPEPKPKDVVKPLVRRNRVINFIKEASYKPKDKNTTSICGLSATQLDKVVLIDQADNQVYILNQLGQIELKLNLEILENLQNNDFASGGDFTGYQFNRKYRSQNKFSNQKNLSWKVKLTDDKLIDLSYDVSNLTNGWHHLCFTISINQTNESQKAVFYIDSIPVNKLNLPVTPTTEVLYKYRTSIILGATPIQNTLINNFLNISDGFKVVGKVSELKMYDYSVSEQDVEELYYSSDLSPQIKQIEWNMPTGNRNYIEQISKWFKFQMPTNKSKFFNLNIHNLNVDENIKPSIQNAIMNSIKKLTPAHLNLNKINWVNKNNSFKNKFILNNTFIKKKPEFDNIYIGFGASNTTGNNEHWIHDFSWNSDFFDLYQMNDLLVNSNFSGDAKIIGTSIRLTDKINQKYGNVFFKIPVRILNDTNDLINWSVYFSFSIGGGNVSDDGLSFSLYSSKNSIQNIQTFPKFGYQNILNSIGVLFLNSISDSSAITNGGKINIADFKQTKNLNFNLNGTTGTERRIYTWIDYIDNLLIISASLENDKNSAPFQMSSIVDIAELLNK